MPDSQVNYYLAHPDSTSQVGDTITRKHEGNGRWDERYPTPELRLARRFTELVTLHRRRKWE